MRRIFYAALGFLFLCGATTGFAQAQAPTPERAGRLSYVEGAVSVRVPGDDRWTPAQLNLPVTTGTALWTEPGARAEIQIGASTIRVDGETELDVTRLDDQAVEIAVPEGAASLHRARTDESPIWVATGNGAVVVAEPGFYRVADGAVVRAEANPTEFDRWAMAREEAETRATAATLKYVSPATTGYQDLAAAGDWTVTPDYGAVWLPRAVPVGWAPYRYGHWAYILPWGWTWIDDAPWGFAPFHYGNWISWHGRWAWWPGERVARPVFVPARVVIVVGGHDRHGPPQRWIPLAPRESAPRVAVNVHVDVDRFANRGAASSLPRTGAARFAERREASAPHRDARESRAVAAREALKPKAAPRDEARQQDVGRTSREAERHAASPPAVGPAVAHAAPSRAAPALRSAERPVAKSETRADRRDDRPRSPETRAVPTAQKPEIAERPTREATQRPDRRVEQRRPPETRIAAPVSAPQERARLAAPPARHEADRAQQQPARAEAAAPRAPARAAPESRRQEAPRARAQAAAPPPRPQAEVQRAPAQTIHSPAQREPRRERGRQDHKDRQDDTKPGG